MSLEATGFRRTYKHPDSSTAILITGVTITDNAVRVFYSASDLGLDTFDGDITLTGNGSSQTINILLDEYSREASAYFDRDVIAAGEEVTITVGVTEPEDAMQNMQWKFDVEDTSTGGGGGGGSVSEPEIVDCSIGDVQTDRDADLSVRVTISNPTSNDLEVFYAVNVDGDRVENERVSVSAGDESTQETTIRGSRLPIGENMPVSMEITNTY